MQNFDTNIPMDYIEGVATDLELTVDYLVAEFLIDGALELEVYTFVPNAELK